ncbi:DUF2946 family protein [Glaciimonas sp. CA11.2]|uniref:DUF2946 family protein n=1 Tax=unclassified Glaciimonas TaxID=2644401 RepID=UPI002AB5C9FD|nr:MULTISPECIES: DUF2946 family protein [unclassified Glaciimonas]MDY7546667.1 DUF2946 family protein [Glaciimonas sp. CA11.2]MEB0011792.1 DUF2946 family protein [Glaciimonas sp. Cout2]MEB0080652.1 DUF2946 family protein [Glaciimonas sp. Gout2]MEB0162124.1 DUF2946 family protein [Glaciimonas sp. CA11.2]
MDDIVKKAMQKWPDVPACFGWLALDARGAWRMRDEETQRHDLPGNKIMHTALCAFINRNYSIDALGRGYFQNGPQCVYVDLALTPYIAHTDPALGIVLQTGEVLTEIDQVLLTEQGQPLFVAGNKVSALDDRDIADWMTGLRMNGLAVADERLLEWIASSADQATLIWQIAEKTFNVERTSTAELPGKFKFEQRPRQLE